MLCFRYQVSRPLWRLGEPCWVRDMRIAQNGHDGWVMLSVTQLSGIMTEQADNWQFTDDVPPARPS